MKPNCFIIIRYFGTLQGFNLSDTSELAPYSVSSGTDGDITITTNTEEKLQEKNKYFYTQNLEFV